MILSLQLAGHRGAGAGPGDGVGRAPGQTPDRLRAAIAAYLALPRMTPADEVVRGEGAPRRADDPAPRRRSQGMAPGRERLELAGTSRPDLGHALDRHDHHAVGAHRAVRLSRLLTSEEARHAALEPWQRPTNRPSLCENELGPERERFSLVTLLAPQHRVVPGPPTTATRSPAGRWSRSWRSASGSSATAGDSPTGSTTWCPISCPACRPTRTPAGPSATPHSPWPRRTGRTNGRSSNLPPETRLIYSAGTDGRDDQRPVPPVRHRDPGRHGLPHPSLTGRVGVCPGRSPSPRQGAIGRSRGASAPRGSDRRATHRIHSPDPPGRNPAAGLRPGG